jgi:hypothetical protein
VHRESVAGHGGEEFSSSDPFVLGMGLRQLALGRVDRCHLTSSPELDPHQTD